MATSLFCGATGFVVYLCACLVLLRAVPAVSPAKVVCLSAAVGFALTVAIPPLLGSQIVFWPLSITFGFLTVLFLMVFGAAYKSVSLHMLNDLTHMPGYRAPYSDIQSRYVEEDSFRNRLTILLSEGLARMPEPSVYVLTEKGEMLAKVLERMHRLFAIRTIG